MGMTILVSVNNYTLPDIKSVKSLENIDFNNVDCLIFHSTTDGDVETIRTLTKLKGVVDKIIYINKNMHPLLYCIFIDLEADIYSEEDFLLDADILQTLIGNFKGTGMTIPLPSADIETIVKAVATISSSNIDNLYKILQNGYWLQTVNTAIENVDKSFNVTLSSTTGMVKLLEETYLLAQNLESSNMTLTTEIEKLHNLLREMETKGGFGSQASMFTTYTIPAHVKSVLYVKAHSNCRYLISFLLAYQNYLKIVKMVDSKVLFVFPKLKGYISKYEGLAPRLAQDTLNIVDMNMYNSFITLEPKPSVLESFFTHDSTPVHIVVDLSLGEILVKGYMVKELFAVGGMSDIKRLGLNPSQCITSIVSEKSHITIPHLSGYVNADTSTRKAMYFEKARESFRRIDSLIIGSD